MHKSADIPRISVQTVQDWNLVKANVAQAMKKAVDDTQTDTKSKEVLLAHLLDVRPSPPRCSPTYTGITVRTVASTVICNGRSESAR